MPYVEHLIYLLLNDYDDKKQVAKFIENINATYKERGRHYHNLKHVEKLCKLIDTHVSHLDMSAWYWAAIFHDFVYEPGSNLNEIRSSMKATEIMQKFRVSNETIILTNTLILSTADKDSGKSFGQFFSDLDYLILGSIKRSYVSYAKGIRKEFGHLNDYDYANGRSKFLIGLLESKHIFTHPNYFQVQEKRARVNLVAELQDLEMAMAEMKRTKRKNADGGIKFT